jgi:YidC/Oxa1 family membrane protein insertase
VSFLNPLYTAVAWVMVHIHSVLSLFLNPSSGLAWALTIVVLVVLMRLILVPLFIKQMHAMRKMSALAPQLQELRKKYKGDKQTLNEETMRLYRENGVNPLGGCLPLVAQLPMFFALFNVLRGIAGWHRGLPLPYGLTTAVVHSAQNANILGARISDKVLFTGHLHVPLHAKIVILCAVAVSVVTTFLTVRQSTKRGMTPQMTPDNPMAASQKYMTYIVPFFALSGLYWAFGLVLYWVTTNIWTLGQQYVIFKRYPPQVPAGAPGADGASPPAPTAASKPTAAKPGTRPRPAAPGKSAASGPAGQSTPAGGTTGSAATGGPKPSSGGAGQARRKKPQTGAARKPAAPPAGTAGQRAPANGSGAGPGILRRIGRARPEPEPEPEAPAPKLVRQQRSRQSRSKRSGKR